MSHSPSANSFWLDIAGVGPSFISFAFEWHYSILLFTVWSLFHQTFSSTKDMTHATSAVMASISEHINFPGS